MNHDDHVHLLHDGIPASGGVWADLGSGWGAFTLALADLIGPTGRIYSVDKDPNSMREQEQALRARFPEVPVRTTIADFTRRLDLPPLDGVVLANALHFVPNRHGEQEEVVQLIKSYLRPDGRLILVEYNADEGNQWVPHGKEGCALIAGPALSRCHESRRPCPFTARRHNGPRRGVG